MGKGFSLAYFMYQSSSIADNMDCEDWKTSALKCLFTLSKYAFQIFNHVFSSPIKVGLRSKLLNRRLALLPLFVYGMLNEPLKFG